MSEFQAYLQLGFDHITDSNGYDHILFIMALCTIYTLVDWKKVIVLITAFTIGHSVTLALSTLNIISVKPALVELLIPVTIVITACANFFYKPRTSAYSSQEGPFTYRYPMAIIFGLIHGMGFSNYLRALLGKESNIIQPLAGFNIGLELGQLVIVFVILAIAFVLVELFRVQKTAWNQIVSGIIIGMAFSLILNNEFFRELTGMSVN